MSDEVRYLTDDRDLPEEDQRELVIFLGGNGDWYVKVAPRGRRVVHGVRICTSGGGSTTVPGLGVAIANAYRAIKEAESGKRDRVPSYQDLEAEVIAWRKRVPTHEYRPQDDCIALKLEE